MVRTAQIDCTSSLVADVDVSTGCVTLRGELDLGTAGLVDGAAQLLLASSVRDVVVRVDDLRFIDAAGLGALVRLDSHLRVECRRLCVEGASDRIRKVFRCAGVERLLSGTGPRSAVDG